jgi:hypothetical protein
MSRSMPSVSGMAQKVEGFVGGMGDKVLELSRDKWCRARLPLLRFWLPHRSCAPTKLGLLQGAA